MGKLISGLKYTIHLPDVDFSGWAPVNCYSGASSQILVSAASGPSSSEVTMLFSMSDFSGRLGVGSNCDLLNALEATLFNQTVAPTVKNSCFKVISRGLVTISYRGNRQVP